MKVEETSCFITRIEKICTEHKRVALFVDMDGTIVEYQIMIEKDWAQKSIDDFIKANPVTPILQVLKKLSNIKNLEIYILSLSKSTNIVKQKKKWLKKYASFIPEENWLILNKENEEYNAENRNEIKYKKMIEKLAQYDYVILLDDDHKILKITKKKLGEKGTAFHISSALI